MAEALRNLQIFRNYDPIIGTAGNVKSYIEGRITSGDLVVKDGEPISVRYKEDINGEVKGLYGVAYVDATLGTKILWGGSGDEVNITVIPDDSPYVNLILNQLGNDYEIEAVSNTIDLNDITTLGTETGIADARDVKEHIEYYNVVPVPGDDIIVISSVTAPDANGFSTTTFSVSISTENLPAAPEYKIGTTDTTQGYLKTYALFKGDNLVANSTIDIPKDFLVKSGNVIEVVNENGHFYDKTNDPTYQHELTDNIITTHGAGMYIDFIVNVKDGTPAVDEHIYIPVNELSNVYTVGTGLAMNNNEIVARKSNDNGNMIDFGTDGGLFVPAGDTIVGVESKDLTGEANDITYGVIGGHTVVLTWDNGNWYYDNGGTLTLYSGEVYTAEAGHKYIVVITSAGHQYWAKNDATDIHATGFTITSNGNDDVLRITMTSGYGPYDVAISSIAERLPEAYVVVNGDTMSIGTEGILTQLALGTIEAYIDNFDCGTF